MKKTSKLKLIGELECVKLYYDSTMKSDSFLVMRKGNDLIPRGKKNDRSKFLLRPAQRTSEDQSSYIWISHEKMKNLSGSKGVPFDKREVDAILKKSKYVPWKEMTAVICGFSDLDTFKKIKKIYEKNK